MRRANIDFSRRQQRYICLTIKHRNITSDLPRQGELFNNETAKKIGAGIDCHIREIAALYPCLKRVLSSFVILVH